MSSPSPPFRMSAGLDVLPPKTGTAYPVPCDEWVLLKNRLSEVSGTPFVLHTIGSILLGAALATLIAIWTDTVPPGDKGKTLVIAWAITVVTAFCGTLCLIFSGLQHRLRRRQVSDVIATMETIEKRYSTFDEAGSPQLEGPKLVIEKAIWSAKGKEADVTEILRGVAKPDSITLIASVEILPDPFYGEQKTLTVDFVYSGKRDVKTVVENKLLKIP